MKLAVMSIIMRKVFTSAIIYAPNKAFSGVAESVKNPTQPKVSYRHFVASLIIYKSLADAQATVN